MILERAIDVGKSQPRKTTTGKNCSIKELTKDPCTDLTNRSDHTREAIRKQIIIERLVHFGNKIK